ncbi:transcription initiation factor IIB [Natronorarus salvus]|uniref:transcription initiation factor IIB n=1 Tax=Natronorarus salvus TaxID=3117733 RepID=UPI002F25F9C8
MCGEAICPDCSGRVDDSGRERICSECGLVVSEHWIDYGPNWRSGEDGDRGRHTGAPLTRSRHDRGLSTTIGYGGEVRLTGRKRRLVARMRREHGRAQCRSKAERNQRDVFCEIRQLTDTLGLPDDVRDEACDLFRKAQREDIVRGRSLEGFAAATVYAACRVAGLPRPAEEVVEASKASTAELTAAYNALNREVGLATGPVDPRRYLPNFASTLELSPSVESRAHGLVSDAQEATLVGGRNPCGVAAACLWVAACEDGTRLTQTDAAGVADVSTATIRSTVDTLRESKMTRV